MSSWRVDTFEMNSQHWDGEQSPRNHNTLTQWWVDVDTVFDAGQTLGQHLVIAGHGTHFKL